MQDAVHRTDIYVDGHTGIIRNVVFSHDRQRVVSGSADGTVKLWVASMSQDVPEMHRSNVKGPDR